MKFQDLVVEYIAVNVFNPITEKAITRIAELFQKRASVALLSDITLASIGQFKKTCFDTHKIKPVTYNGYLKYLRKLGDYAVEKNYLKINQFREVKLAPIGLPPRKTLSDFKISYLITWLESNPDTCYPWWFWVTVIKTLHLTGIRRRQLVQLKLGDILLPERKIVLRYESSKTKKEWDIPIHEILVPQIKAYVAQYESVTGRKLGKDDYLFSIFRLNPRYSHKNTSDPMQPEQITSFFVRISKKIGFATGAHRFRHTLATNLCNPTDGYPPDIFAVQSLLGHQKLETTQIYVENQFDQIAKMLNRLPVSKPHHCDS